MASWITDLRHFLNEKGALPHDLPAPANKLAHTLGEIVVFATSPYPETQTMIPCADHFLEQKQCSSYIIACLDNTDRSIHWECSHCDSYGVITGWQHSIWDFGGESSQGH